MLDEHAYFPCYLFTISPEPLGAQGELIVYQYTHARASVRRRPSSVSKIFFSETA